MAEKEIDESTEHEHVVDSGEDESLPMVEPDDAVEILGEEISEGEVEEEDGDEAAS